MPNTVKFYTDEHVAASIVRQLREKGVDIVSCQEVGNLGIPDVEQLQYAVQQQRTVITGDADFLRLDSQWRNEGKRHSGIIHIKFNHPDQMGPIVAWITFLCEAVNTGAADLERDVYNRVQYV